MFEVLGAIFGGGLTGLAGNLITQIINYLNLRAQQQHDLELIRVNTESAVALAKVKTEGELDVEEAKAFTESQKAAQAEEPLFKQSYMQYLLQSTWLAWIGALLAVLFGVVDFVKALIRPVLTIYLLGASTWITVLSYRTVQEALQVTGQLFPAAEAMDLFQTTVITVLYLTVTAVTWYYSDRRTAKFLAKMLDKRSLS